MWKMNFSLHDSAIYNFFDPDMDVDFLMEVVAYFIVSGAVTDVENSFLINAFASLMFFDVLMYP